jgi:hypothetical protein
VLRTRSRRGIPGERSRIEHGADRRVRVQDAQPAVHHDEALGQLLEHGLRERAQAFVAAERRLGAALYVREERAHSLEVFQIRARGQRDAREGHVHRLDERGDVALPADAHREDDRHEHESAAETEEGRDATEAGSRAGKHPLGEREPQHGAARRPGRIHPPRGVDELLPERRRDAAVGALPDTGRAGHLGP